MNTEEMAQIGQAMEEAHVSVERGSAAGAGYSSKLVAAQKLAHEIGDPTERIWSYGNEFASHLHDVDEGFRAIIGQAAAQSPQLDEDETYAICDFFKSVREMAAAAGDALDSVEGMIEAIEPLEGLSRDLRPRLRRLREGLTIMLEAREVTNQWVHLTEVSGVVCEEEASN